VAALTPTRRAIRGRSHLTTRPPWLAPSAETDFAPLGRGLARPSPSSRSWSSGARERHLTTTCRPCPPPGPPREAFLALSARPGAMPDTVARRLRCRITSAPPPKRRLHPPEGGRRAPCEPSGPVDCARRVPPASSATERGRYGSVPGTQAHVPKNARALRTQTSNSLATARRRRRPSARQPESRHARPDPPSATRQRVRRLPRARKPGVRDW